jgi:thiol-disulfide isomerase/thioredoxin
MWKLNFILFSCIVFSQSIIAQSKNTKLNLSVISSFELKKITDSNSISFTLPRPAKPLLLFIFLSPECPLSKNYTLTLNQLFNQYGDQVQFYGCVSGSGFSYAEIKSFINTYKVLFPMIVDKNKRLTKYIAATVTPEVMLLNRSGEMIYSGAIDDWIQELGKQKSKASKHYLQDAIAAGLSNKNIAVKKTIAYGCLINDY